MAFDIDSITSPIMCKACNSTNISNLGTLQVHEGTFDLHEPGNIYECSSCGLFYRHPYFSPAQLDKIYLELDELHWIEKDRKDQDLIRNYLITLFQSGNILDIGCYRGEFLLSLPSSFNKFGIEPSKAARNIARSRGIQLVGSTINKIEIEIPFFHVITLIDVVEHLPNPFTALCKVINLILPGGLLIISTGNTDVLPWRLQRQDYWYYFPEHVSFFNPQWFHWFEKKLNMEILKIKKFSYFNGKPSDRWIELIACLTYRLSDHFKGNRFLKTFNKVYPFSRASQWSAPPATIHWPDHLFVVLKRKF